MNFFQIKEKTIKGRIAIYPQFVVSKNTDLMIRGGYFYAIWDDEKSAWSTDQYDVVRLVDAEMQKYYEANRSRYANGAQVLYLKDFETKSWLEFIKFTKSIADNFHPLDERLTFANTETKRTDYVSRHLPYALEPGSYKAYDELISTLYSDKEREKIEWAIGSVISGDSKKIQKFFVFYGEGGTGKSTVLNIIQKLFEGYYSVFDAKSLGASSNQFATEVFKNNPLVAIQHDGDLSKIDDNTRLNQIIAHEELVVNEKNKALYSMRINSMLFMGTNTPVKITGSKSGIIRRLIDISPTGNRIPFKRYTELMKQIEFELSGIAWHCLEVYKKLGMSYYNGYKPRSMIQETDFFYNFVEENYFNFKEADGVTVKQAYDLFKNFCENNGGVRPMIRNQFITELKTYFRQFYDITRIDGKQVRSWCAGFKTEKFGFEPKPVDILKDTEAASWIVLDKRESIFDKEYMDIPAQGVRIKDGTEIPACGWDKCQTHLKDIDTTKVHYCKPPDNMIVIDFDLKDADGNKSVERNLEAAALWPPTYAEFSKGGAGIHLHYIYAGDPLQLSTVYSDEIEIKIFKGKDADHIGGSLRRRLSLCNDIPIATISSGLPLRSEKPMVDFDTIKNEKMLRARIKKNLRKEYEPHKTVTSVDYIYNDLEKCYSSGMRYDVRDMRPDIMAFANNSTHNADKCLRTVSRMHFCSEEKPSEEQLEQYAEQLIFYDVEVFPNLFLVNWKLAGDENKCVRMINPKPADIEELCKHRLVGFNCRRYDNHILWARMLGYTNEQLFMLSQRIVSGSKNAMFGEAYNLSYTDVYDFCATKQSLKKWEIELDIHHQELGLPWDEPVPEEKWIEVAEYCDNDVIATEATFNANQADFRARQILAELAKMLTGYGTVNDTTNQLTTRIILRGDKNANKQFVYPDLAKEFPGYEFNPLGFPEEKYTEELEKGAGGKKLSHKSFYRGCDPSEGGRVYAHKGAYDNVKTFDVASMHPSSIIAENGFGKYTQNFKDLLDIRLAIKHKDYDKAKTFFDGALAPYLTDAKAAKQLSFALKIAINSVYGLTSAKFDNALRDPRNIDNWVAKRGALFMIDLQKEVESRGFTVVHVKTDSIKVANPTPELEDFILKYGKEHGYSFEIEAVYDRICLVNRAVYIARYSMEHPDEEERWKWTATGDQFKQPYIFKTLFSKEPIEFKDMCETKTVKSALYLDMNEGLPEGEHDYHFIGKAGLFCPVKDGVGGGYLLRDAGDGKFASAEGAKGYRWMEAEMVKNLGLEDQINRDYYNRLVDEAKDDISMYTDFERFVADEPFVALPWEGPSQIN